MSSPRPLRDLAAIFIIVVATFTTFARVGDFEFTSWDDYDTVARNPLMNPPTARSFRTFWTRPHADLYIPLTYSLWGAIAAAPASWLPATPTAPPRLSPQGFHLFNVALHAAAAMLMFGVLEMLVANRAAALVGTLLFALHPVQVESVAWVSGMKDVLFGMLSLMAIYEYLKFVREARGTLRRAHYVVATLAFVLAMLAKPTAVVVPLLVIVLDHWMLGRPLRQVLRSVWPWLLLAVPCAVAAKMIQPAPHARDAAVSILYRPLIATDALAFYLYKLVWPATLSFDYGRTPQYVVGTRMLFWTWLAPVAVAAIAWWSWRKGWPVVAAGLAVLIIVLLPVLGFVPFDFQAYSTVADHYLYLAMLGPAMVVAWLTSRLAGNRLALALAACLLVALGVRSFLQLSYWRDSRSLFTHGREVNPRSFASYNSLAALAVEENDPARAIELVRHAIDIRPSASSYHTLGEALRRKGQVNEAIAAFAEALRREPAYTPSLMNLAAALASQGRFTEAEPYARKAVELLPDSVPARINLALIYLDTGQHDAAREQLETVLRLDPGNEPVRQQLRALQQPQKGLKS